MGYRKLECTKGENQCCICCTKNSECDMECDDMDNYEYAENCPNYVRDGGKCVD